jgi:prepilin-type N-terminal cleavage/methylation domain-containing protein
MKKRIYSSLPGFTLIEILVALVISGFALAAVFSGAISIQRCFIAGQEFAEDKKNQSRLSDFLSLDLRRALTVTRGTGNILLTVTIPDFYDEFGKPRMPTIVKYVAQYGDPTKPVTITYERSGSSIYRREGTAPAVEIATGVADFNLDVEDLEKCVKTHVTFTPHFNRANTDSTAAHAGTALHNTIYLRNKRTDIKK